MLIKRDRLKIHIHKYSCCRSSEVQLKAHFTLIMDDNRYKPKIIFLFSGKRKSGKDYACDILLKRIGCERGIIIRLSAPIKSYWAKSNNLILDDLLSSSSYKENYRKAMIKWSESVRNNDYGCFCKAAIEMCKDAENKPVWIISDARRKTDLKWFNENFSEFATIKLIRIVAPDELRVARGWIFEKGVDDGESECDLDSYSDWDLIIYNNDDKKNFDESIQLLVNMYEDVFEIKS